MGRRIVALPAIAPYPLPTAGDLPANRVGWTFDPDRAVLLVHDMQNYFLAPYAGDPIPQVVDTINELRALGLPTVFTAQPADQDPAERRLLTDFWGPGPTGDVSVPAGLAPAPGDTVLTKWRYSAFVRTELAELLGDRDQLVVTGIYGHIGVQATAVDAFMRDIQVFVVADGIADFSAGHHRDALAYLAGRCARVVTAKELTG
ncbi:isochorismatase family protein [Longispora sp. NPDC051575]|uniref:isochorismatase family protein n=1 Tax=Longispora sp. NPDC051575 TaxID=3154943 RepID=UPI00343B1922